MRAIGNVTISGEDERILKSLRITRNAIEHFEWHTSENEARVIVGNGLSFAFTFAKDELGVELADLFREDDTWKLFLTSLHEFARAHGARQEARLIAYGELPMPCDECGETTVPLSGGSCLLCGHWQRIE